MSICDHTTAKVGDAACSACLKLDAPLPTSVHYPASFSPLWVARMAMAQLDLRQAERELKAMRWPYVRAT
jgi:hypothetical protein